MDEIINAGLPAAEPRAPAIGERQITEWLKILTQYKSAKANVDRRVIASEQWWKLHNAWEETKNGDTQASPVQFHSQSGWLHNVIVSKHADAMDSYPEPNILPRERDDKTEATILSSIIPAVIEQNDFEAVYSDLMWQKLKTGTGIYKVTWDANKLNGLGDISIKRANILDVFWTPGVTDIQDSKYVFHTEARDTDEIEAMWPQTRGKLKASTFVSQKFLNEDANTGNTNKHTIIDVYYRRIVNGSRILHYAKFVDDILLYATENDPQTAERGLYDHGMYPFVFDRLFPVEGSPCGYGFVDLCRNPQTEIDLMKTAMLKNAIVGATPRYFTREDGEISEEEFLDLNNPLVHVSGNLGRDSLIQIDHRSLDGNYVTHLQNTIQELRETSGNTETATGSTSGGVTAASAIAALQEASGKGSRDSTQASYRSYAQVVYMCIELIRQFYDLPRQFRIAGQYGVEQFVSYSNAGLKPVSLLGEGAYRLPVFDIKVAPQKRNAYTKMAQNELAIQFFQLGFFSPQMTDQALMCLDMMEFDGKDQLEQKIAQYGTVYQQLIQWQQLGLSLAQKYEPQLVPGLAQSITGAPMGGGSGVVDMSRYRQLSQGAEDTGESTRVQNARAAANQASQPGGATA